MDRILLIDAINSIYRATVAFGPPRKHDECDARLGECDLHEEPLAHCACGAKWDEEDGKCYGEKYGFIFNFFRNLRPQIQDGSPHKIFWILEGRPQFRYDLFPAYKANRITKKASTSQDKIDKFEFSRNEIIRLMQYLPITIARAENYEADDVIATLCENMKDEDLSVISGDGDFVQLLQRGYKHITIYNPIKKIQLEAPLFSAIAHKCLVGDKSDNIPRIVSNKKALQYLNDPSLFRKRMEETEFNANFNCNRQLIEFRQVPEEEIILVEGNRNFPVLKKEFERMDFQSIINDNSWKRYVETFDCVKY
jgi:5'-3' exonuclease